MLTTACVIALIVAQAAAAPAATTPPAAAAPAAPAAAAAPAAVYVPERVYDTRKRAFVDFEVMLADTAASDVIFVGEQHDDPNTHRLEHALVEGLRRRRVPLTVSFEMFERDVQEVLGSYLRDGISEAEFLKGARPWPRYATDYRSVLELAKSEGWAVIAANVPRRLASEVAKAGKDAIDRFAPADRAWAARDLECPNDAYFERFASAMGTHAGAKDVPAEEQARLDRYYWSQCLKDETMAEAIATAVTTRTTPRGAVVHFTGAFHSDFGQGTAERARRRLPGRRLAVISILPVAELDALAPSDEDLKRADYLVYTIK